MRADPKERDEGKAAQMRKKEWKGVDLIVEEPEVAKPSFQPDGMYYAVKQVLKGAVNGFPLNKRFKDESTPDPGFLQPGDERWGRNFNQFKLTKARIVSCSVDSSTGTCRTCLSGEHAAWESADGGPIVLSDQHFPANVPADGPGECLRIIRVENGTLNELADELIRKAPSKGLPAGSVILLLSSSQLYYESVEHYAAEWSRCRNWLRDDLGEVLVLPGLPLTGNGIYSETTVRGLLDFYAWIGRLEGAASGAAANVEKAIALMSDSVHMKKEGYSKLAKQCKDTITTWLLGKKRKAVESYGAEAKKQLMDGQSNSQATSADGKKDGKGGRKAGGKAAGGAQKEAAGKTPNNLSRL